MPTETPERIALTRAADHAYAWLDGLDARSVATTASLETMRERLTRPLARGGVTATQVIDDLVADVEGGILGSQSGRFFAWVIGGGQPAGILAHLVHQAPQHPTLVERVAGTFHLAKTGLQIEGTADAGQAMEGRSKGRVLVQGRQKGVQQNRAP